MRLEDTQAVVRLARVASAWDLRLDSREQLLEVLEQLLGERQLSEAEYLSGMPVRQGYMSSPFGRRVHPLSGRASLHKGADFAANVKASYGSWANTRLEGDVQGALTEGLNARAVLVKGGHLEWSGDLCLDYYQDEHREFWLGAPRLDTRHGHGTGCCYASAIAAVQALDYPVEDAITLARDRAEEILRLLVPHRRHAPAPPMRAGANPGIILIAPIGEVVAALFARACVVAGLICGKPRSIGQRLRARDFFRQARRFHRPAGNHAKGPRIGKGRDQMPLTDPGHGATHNGIARAQKRRARVYPRRPARPHVRASCRTGDQRSGGGLRRQRHQ